MATTRHCGRSWAWAITNERSGPNQGPKRKPRTRQSFFWVRFSTTLVFRVEDFGVILRGDLGSPRALSGPKVFSGAAARR